LAVVLTSLADVIWRGRRAAFRSLVFVSRSYRAVAMEVSSSEGFWRDGLVGAILLRALMVADVDSGRLGWSAGELRRFDIANRNFLLEASVVHCLSESTGLALPAAVTYHVMFFGAVSC
jgi:hypothetical protein